MLGSFLSVLALSQASTPCPTLTTIRSTRLLPGPKVSPKVMASKMNLDRRQLLPRARRSVASDLERCGKVVPKTFGRILRRGRRTRSWSPEQLPRQSQCKEYLNYADYKTRVKICQLGVTTCRDYLHLKLLVEYPYLKSYRLVTRRPCRAARTALQLQIL